MKNKESTTVEFKQQIVEDIKKEVVAFANTEGGTIYIGISDNGDVIGLENLDEVSLQMSNMIRDAIKPDISMFVSYNVEIIEGKDVLKVIVQRGTECPYYIAKKGLRPEGVFVRQGASSVPTSVSSIRRMIKETDGDVFEDVRSLNQELTFKYSTIEFENRGLAFGKMQMKSLGIINLDNMYTNLGLLLSDQCTHAIKAAVFEGISKSVFKDRREFNGSLLKQLNDVYDYINIYNRTRAEFSGLARIDKRDYPEEALRESLLNSLVHREYAYSGSTLVNIFDDRIEFVSLGGLVKGLTVDDIFLGVSQPRNEKLAAIFYRLKLIEAYGTGMQKIMDSYQDWNVKPQVELSDNAFKIILPNTNMKIQKENLNFNEKAVLSYLYEKGEINRKDVENYLSISQTMAGRIIKGLIDKGLITKIGGGANTRYTIYEG